MNRLLACVGLANLVMLAEWRAIGVVFSREFAYLAEGRPPLTYVWATLLSILLIAVSLFALWSIVEVILGPHLDPAGRRLRVLLHGVVLLGVSMLCMSALVRSRAVWALLPVWGVALLFPPSARLLARLCRTCAWSALFLPWLLLNTLYSWARYPLPVETKANVTPSDPSPPERLVWIVFDEMDSRAVFENRPARLRVPALDRLRQGAIYATNAHAAGAWTLDVLPALWLGRPVAQAEESGPRDLFLRFADGPDAVTLPVPDTMFAKARALGHTLAIVGWYHPYCRLFGHLTVRCASGSSPEAFEPLRQSTFASERGAPAAALDLLGWTLLRKPSEVVEGALAPRRIAQERSLVLPTRMAALYDRLHQVAVDVVSDPSVSFVFVHYPIPHLPAVRHPRTSTGGSADSAYLNNLTLADKSFAELRERLEAAGLWERTSILVTSDHGLRPDVWKYLQEWTEELDAITRGKATATIPFLFKKAGQQHAITYSQTFNSVLSNQLVLETLEGELPTPEDVTQWLDANRERVPLTWPVRTAGDRE